jgi:hypothetical protein
MRTYLPRLALATATATAFAGATAGAASAPVIKTARNAKLHHTVLVNRSGHTLYALSAERNYADSRRGDANGEGFKDVGTWHAVVPSH